MSGKIHFVAALLQGGIQCRGNCRINPWFLLLPLPRRYLRVSSPLFSLLAHRLTTTILQAERLFALRRYCLGRRNLPRVLRDSPKASHVVLWQIHQWNRLQYFCHHVFVICYRSFPSPTARCHHGGSELLHRRRAIVRVLQSLRVLM